ncbi:MAG: hypothetical protein KF799_05360 [Bdellovibrionales bacterium]|nr:hypothetical protein [Bdellovibrionales bacterium]
MRSLRRLEAHIVESLVLFVAALIGFSFLRGLVYFSIFQERDLMRSQLVAEGQWFFYGPEIFGGGHLPGPFYYYLNAIPLWFGLGWQGCWYLVIGMAAAGLAVTWGFFRKQFGLEAAFLACLTFLTLPQFYKTMTYFQNFSLLPFLLVLILIGYAMSFALADGARTRYWVMACACIGLALQLHMSVSFIAGGGILLQVIAPWIGLRRLTVKEFSWGIAALAATVAPYYIWLVAYKHGIDIGFVPPKYVGTSHFTLQSFNQTTMVFAGNSGFHQVIGRLLNVDRWLDEFLLLLSAPALVVGLFVWIATRGKGVRPGPLTKLEAATRVWTVCAICAFPAAVTVIFTPHRSRYFTCFLFASTFALAGAIAARLRRREISMPSSALAVMAFLGAILIAFVSTKSQRILPLESVDFQWVMAAFAALFAVQWLWPRAPLWSAAAAIPFLGFMTFDVRFNDAYGKDTPPVVAGLEQASLEMASHTGWPWEKLRERLFLVNFHFQRSITSVYKDTQKRFPRALAGGEPDGYILAFRYKARPQENHMRTWLLKRGLPDTLHNGIRSGEIQLGQPVPVRDGAVVPYTVLDKYKYPPFFQNVGVNYLEFSSDGIARKAENSGSSERLDSDRVRFSFNDCPDLNAFCSIHMNVSRSADDLTVRLEGDVISQPSTAVSPAWSQSLTDVYMGVQCKTGEKMHKYHLVDRIGVIIDTILPRHLNTIVLAPAERLVKNPCRGPIHQLVMGYDDSEATISRKGFRRLGGRQLTMNEF